MPAARSKGPALPFDASSSLLEAFAINDRINQFLLENLSEEVWRADPPMGKGRTVAAIVSPMHNVRVMWLKAPSEARKALEESRGALANVLQSALDSDGRVKGFRPDVAAFFGYLIAHDAHHRGQITMLARQVGHPIDQKTMFGMWEWGVR